MRDRLKAKLGNTEVRTMVDKLVSEKLMIYLEENPQVARLFLKSRLRLQGQRGGKKGERA